MKGIAVSRKERSFFVHPNASSRRGPSAV